MAPTRRDISNSVSLLLCMLAAVSFLPTARADKTDKSDDPYTAGKVWLGELEQAKGNLKKIRIKARNGDRVNFVFQGAAAGAIWETSGLLHNGSVSLDILNRIVNPAGHEAVAVKEVSGSAVINADGSLNLAVSGRAFGDGANNRPIGSKFVNAQPK